MKQPSFSSGKSKSVEDATDHQDNKSPRNPSSGVDTHSPDFVKRQKFSWRNVENLGLYIVFVVIFICLSVASPYFLTSTNVFDILRQSTFVLVVALGSTLVIMTAGIDLSVGAVLGFSAGITSWLLLQGLPTVPAVLGGLACGAFCGLLNGLIITQLEVTDFVATLATMSAFRGALFLMTMGVPFARFARPSFSFLGRGMLGPVPAPVIIVAILFLILSYLLTQTRFGRHLLAVGSNRDAAYLSGVQVNLTKILVYTIAGVCSGLAGILLSSRLSSVPPDLGTGYELQAIAAVVIGGTALSGGKGTLLGTVVGAVMIGMIANGPILLNVNPFYQYIINGALIVIAVSLNRPRKS